MTIDTKTLRLAEATYRDRAHHATADLLRDAADTIDAQAAEIKRLREALLWTAAALQACCSEGIREASNITINPDTKTFGEILDMADAALDRVALQGESHD